MPNDHAPTRRRPLRAAPFLRGGTAALLLVTLLGTPVLAADSDGDGLRDGFEARWGVTDPFNPDSDGDGVIDSAEDSDGDGLGNLGEQRFGSNPGARDSDGDGVPDGREDHDGDGRSNAREQDQRPLPTNLRPTLAKAADDIWEGEPACNTRARMSKARRCRFANLASETTIAVVGDSKAVMLMPAFIAAAERAGWRVVSLLKGACPPVLGTLNSQQYALDRGRSCRAWRHDVIGRLNADPPNLIVLAHSDDYRLVDTRGRTLLGARKVKAWRRGTERTLAALPATSKALVLGDVPSNKGNPLRCLQKHRDDMSVCQTARLPMARRAIERALRDAARGNGARFGTLHDQVCTYDPCPLVQGRVLMWRDQGHLTVTFTQRLAPSMQALLADTLASSP